MKNSSIVFILFFSLQAFANNNSIPATKTLNEKSIWNREAGFLFYSVTNNITEHKVSAEPQLTKRKKKKKKPVNQINKKGKKKIKKRNNHKCHKW